MCLPPRLSTSGITRVCNYISILLTMSFLSAESAIERHEGLALV